LATDASKLVSIPAWAIARIQDGEKEKTIFHIYEIKFELETGSSFVEERSGTSGSAMTSLGVAFPMNVQPLNRDGIFEINQLFIKQKNSKDLKRVTA
jgi:hypothetical protein